MDEKTLPLAISAVISRPDGRFLVIRRGPDVPFPGIWATVTGKIEPGESPEAAVVREAREEVGLDVGVGRVLFHCPTSDHRYMLRWFEAPVVDESQPLALNEEVAEARWILPEEVIQLEPAFQATLDFFKALCNEKKKA